MDYRAGVGVLGNRFVGLVNFRFLFSNDLALRATRNTIMLNLLFIVAAMNFTLFVAALIFKVYTSVLTRYYQTVLLFPVFISWEIFSSTIVDCSECSKQSVP